MILGVTSVRGQDVRPASATPALTVEAAMARALANHPRIGAARENVRAARGSRLTARSWANPTLNYQSENMPLSGRPALLSREVMTFAMLPLEPLYQLWPRSSQASAEVRAAEADLRGIRRDIAVGAAAAFYSVASAELSVDALGNVRLWLDSLVEYTRARVREGAAAEVDLIRLEVEHGRAETELALARVDLARAQARLSTFVGSDSISIAIQIDSAAPISTIANSDLVARATSSAPSLQAAQARADAARAGLAVERSRMVRELGVMAGVKTMEGTRTLMAGFSLSLPLFDQNRGEIQRADARQRMVTFEREAVTREVIADVTALHAAYVALSNQLASMQGSLLRRAEEARRVAQGAYREGATSIVQVLDAARALSEARHIYHRALFARQMSLIELNAALGVDDAASLLRPPLLMTPSANSRQLGRDDDR